MRTVRAKRALPTSAFVTIAVACVLFGIAIRIVDANHKIYYQDESVTSIRAAGFTLRDVYALFDTKAHTFAEIRRVLKPAADRGPAATVASLATEDPQHPPLYYVLASLWVRVFGNGAFAIRALSIVLGLAVLPLGYLLARELFASQRAALLVVAFLAVSPFFVLYGYQAREYGAFAAATLLSTLLFVRARRRGGAVRWSAYALSIALGTYTYLFFLFVVASHACVALFAKRPTVRDLLPFVSAALAGIALSAPWLAIVVANARSARDDVSWATSAYPLKFVVAKWLFFTGATFFDLEYVRPLFAIVAALVLIVIALASRTFWRDRDRDVRTTLVSLGLVTFVCLAVPDIVFHHRFSTIARYLAPTWLAIVFVVAASLAERSHATVARVALGFLLLCAVASDVASASADSWWENSGNKSIPALATILDTKPGVLLVSEADYAPLLVLAPLVAPDAIWVGYRASSPATFAGATTAGTTYVLSPTGPFLADLQRRTHRTARIVFDSHDFSSVLTRVRGATFGERAGRNDWGEVVLWRLVDR